jgi:MFS family permease
LFAAANDADTQWMVLVGIILHGICYDFFFVTGFIYTDKKCDKRIRGQAQGLLVLITQGLGLGLGAQIVAAIKTAYTEQVEQAGEMVDVVDWFSIWRIAAIASAVVLVAFFLLFHDRVRVDNEADVVADPEPAPVA